MPVYSINIAVQQQLIIDKKPNAVHQTFPVHNRPNHGEVWQTSFYFSTLLCIYNGVCSMDLIRNSIISNQP